MNINIIDAIIILIILLGGVVGFKEGVIEKKLNLVCENTNLQYTLRGEGIKVDIAIKKLDGLDMQRTEEDMKPKEEEEHEIKESDVNGEKDMQTEEEKNDLWINIEGEYGFESLKEQANEFQEKFDLEYICNNNMSLIENSFNSLFSEKYEELQKRYVEAEWDNYVRDSIVDEIYDKIIEIREAAETDEEE